MANIFTLMGEVFVENQKANRAIDETTGKAETGSSNIGAAFSTITKGAAAIGTAVVAGAAALGTAAFKMASDTAAAADQIDKMSQKIGISRQAYQEWDYIMSQNGISVDILQSGLKTLTSQMDSARSGTGSASEAFKALGISVTNADGSLRSQEEVFEEAIQALQGMSNETERARLATKLFGRAGTELAPLLNSTAESTEQLRDRAHELGMVMSDETIDAGVKFTDAMDNIKRSLTGMMNTLGGAVLPIVQTVLDLIISKIPEIQALFGRLTPVIEKVFSNLLPPLLELAETLLPLLFDCVEALLPPLEAVLSSILPVIIQLIQTLLPFIITIVQQLLPTLINSVLPVLVRLLNLISPILEPILNLLIRILDPLFQILSTLLPPICSIIQTLFGALLPTLTSALSLAADMLSAVFGNALDTVSNILKNIIGVFQNVIDFVKNVFTGNWRGAWQNVVSIFGNIFQGIVNLCKAPINVIIDLINGFIRGLNRIQIPSWVPGVGGRGINISEIPKLRVGLEYVPYDDFPALLHKGERVLTASESKEYSEREKAQPEKRTAPVIRIELGEKAIYIDSLNTDRPEDIDSFVEWILEVIEEKIKRKGVVFS